MADYDVPSFECRHGKVAAVSTMIGKQSARGPSFVCRDFFCDINSDQAFEDEFTLQFREQLLKLTEDFARAPG